MHIIENKNVRAGRTYCYIGECIWDKKHKKSINRRVPIGHLEGEPSIFVPNRMFASILRSDIANQSATETRTREMIDTVNAKYGCSTDLLEPELYKTDTRTAKAIFSGPSIVFGGITSRYNIDTMLMKAFGADDAQVILSLAWYLACEGDALVNSDVWLSHYENPAGCPISSQDITKLLDRMAQNDIMSFYKHWLEGFKQTGDKILYDLTSISSYCRDIDMVNWGHNRDKENLPQVNFVFLWACFKYS